MIIQKINESIDIIMQGESDIDNMTNDQLIDQIETENKLYYFERMRRKQQRQCIHKQKTILNRVLQTLSSL